MVHSGVFDVKRIDLEISAARRSFPYDVKLGKYALSVKEGPADKVAVIKGPEVRVSVRHLKDLLTSARAPSRAS